MRNLEEVIDKIIDQQLDIEKDKVLINELNRIKVDIMYTAPEVMGIRWRQTYSLLMNSLNLKSTNEKAIKIFSIFSGNSEESIIEQLKKEEEQVNG